MTLLIYLFSPPKDEIIVYCLYFMYVDVSKLQDTFDRGLHI